MPLSSRRIPRDHVHVASPFRMELIAGGTGAPVEPKPAAAPPVAVPDPQQTQRAIESAFRAGLEEGAATARAEAEHERSQMSALFEAHERELGRLNDDLARAVIALAVDLARHVTRAQVALKEDAVMPVVRDALALLREDATPSRLLLAPGDAALVERNLGAVLADRNCRIVPDPAITHGECRLEAPYTDIDATLATRWRKAIAPLGETRDWID